MGPVFLGVVQRTGLIVMGKRISASERSNSRGRVTGACGAFEIQPGEGQVGAMLVADSRWSGGLVPGRAARDFSCDQLNCARLVAMNRVERTE